MREYVLLSLITYVVSMGVLVATLALSETVARWWWAL